MRCAALTCRSYYSLLTGALSVERIIQTATTYGYGAVALTDINAMYGLVDFVNTARKHDVCPIIGVDIRTGQTSVKLLAENKTGYRSLCRITTARNIKPDFDILAELDRNSAGIVCISSCPAMLNSLRDIVPPDSLFAACTDDSAANWARSHGFRPLACRDFNVITDDDITTARLLLRIKQLSSSPDDKTAEPSFNKLPPHEDLLAAFKRFPEAIANNRDIFHRCSELNLLDGTLFLPRVRLPQNASAHRTLAARCHTGLARRYGTLKSDTIRRLEKELDVIRDNGFSDYFLVVAEIIDFARKSNIPVDVRGSAAGSLVSYVLGFTRVCPIRNNLYFERFMNPGRTDCPDIDVDLCWRRRDEVIDFCYRNWGAEYVAMISTISRYRLRSSIRDAARALTIPPWRIKELLRGRKQHPDRGVYKLAERLIDLPRHIGVHCGGIVITPQPVCDLSPLQIAAKGIVVTQYDKNAASAMGLVKIDLLGNRSLSTVNETVNIIKRHDLDIDHIDPSDKETAQMLTDADSFGVFQCESPGMRQLLRGLRVNSKNDLAIALSLIRPGPAAGGMKTEYIRRHVYKKKFDFIHPRMKEIFADTYGVMLFQEDVMKLAVEIAGYSVADADRFRSEVSKKVSSRRLHNQYLDFVYNRADSAGIDRQTAENIWSAVLQFAAYSYCKAHATVYANIAWQTAWLKAHFPREFYTALLNNHTGMYPRRIYVWDAMRHGIKVLPPHVNHSQSEWSLQGKTIRAGLNIIKGLTVSSINAIIEQRNRKKFADFNDFRTRLPLKRPEIASLVHVGACDGLGKTRPNMLSQLNFAPVPPGQLLMFDLRPQFPASTLGDYDRFAKLKAQIDVTAIPFCMHPELLIRQRHVLARSLPQHIDREVTVAGFVAAARKARTNDGKTMGFVTLEDSTGLIEISFFPDKLEQYTRAVSQSGPIWVRGRVTCYLSSLNIESCDCGNAL